MKNKARGWIIILFVGLILLALLVYLFVFSVPNFKATDDLKKKIQALPKGYNPTISDQAEQDFWLHAGRYVAGICPGTGALICPPGREPDITVYSDYAKSFFKGLDLQLSGWTVKLLADDIKAYINSGAATTKYNRVKIGQYL